MAPQVCFGSTSEVPASNPDRRQVSAQPHFAFSILRLLNVIDNQAQKASGVVKKLTLAQRFHKVASSRKANLDALQFGLIRFQTRNSVGKRCAKCRALRLQGHLDFCPEMPLCLILVRLDFYRNRKVVTKEETLSVCICAYVEQRITG